MATAADTTPTDFGYVNVSQNVKGSEGLVDVQPYDSRWSLQPFLEEAEGLTVAERSWLEGLEEKLKVLSSKTDVVQQPLPTADIQALIRFFFPPFKRSFRYGALMRPLAPQEVLVTQDWFELLTGGQIIVSSTTAQQTATVRAGLMILNQLYGQKLDDAYGNEIDYHHTDTDLISHLKVYMGHDYVRVLVHGEKPKLTRGQIRELLGNLDDVDLWVKRLPPKNFSFYGLEMNHVLDATEEISRRNLQNLLLKREAVLSDARVEEIQKVLRIYLRVPELKVGVMALDYPRSRAVSHRYLIRQDLLAGQVDDILDPAYGETIYYETCLHGSVRIYDDLADCLEENGTLDEKIIHLGYRSLVLVPLFGKGDHIIGMLELASPQPYAFNNLVIYQLEEIAPLFRQAVRRSRGDIEARIQAVMRKTFTTIDPSVEWRFVQAAASIIEQEHSNEDSVAVMEPIRFEDVWALYAQADIVSSSRIRNQAIRSDLLQELDAAERLLLEPAVDLRFPLAGKLVYDIGELRAELADDMSPNDEQHVLEFLKYSFEPTLAQFRDLPELALRIKAYEEHLASLRVNGRTNRDAYELSVQKVTSVVNSVISQAQQEAQRIVPHYFSKYRTDGVEFNIYAGQSLLRDGQFSEIHLQNLRLWQLQTMVDVTKAIAGLRDTLPTPMSTAQLIFAFGNRITIQFRMDEKRFDVEGAYNVRYEIIKKRIDKALVRGTEQRLTLADHIAVVYSHHTDRRIYHELIEYLHGSGEVVGEVEDLELESMQGVDGLYALRVRVV